MDANTMEHMCTRAVVSMLGGLILTQVAEPQWLITFGWVFTIGGGLGVLALVVGAFISGLREHPSND